MTELRGGDTIAAIATAPGEGAIGIVRLSGDSALAIADKIFRPLKGVSPSSQKSHTARVGRLVAEDGLPVDEAICLVMRGPRSVTGEDVVELQAHGGPAVLQQTLALTLRYGARAAGRGEFTQRAFLNGRIDLVQAEAVLDLVRARTELGSRWAARRLGGSLSEALHGIKEELLEARTHLEASIDFPDDAPETETIEDLTKRLSRAAEAIARLLRTASLGMIAQEGCRVVISGKPNVGKSSLMNALLRRDRVIVAPLPGTTRDSVSEEISIRGLPVRLVDTAGLRSSEDPIEREGVERTKREVRESGLVLFVVDSSLSPDAEELALWETLAEIPRILVLNKCDLSQETGGAIEPLFKAKEASVRISCLTGQGIELLEERIFSMATHGQSEPEGGALVSTARQREHLNRALEAVERALAACRERAAAELIALEVRLALDELGRLVGEIVNDQMLELLFKRFCIGK